jgi:hypothetical protein
MRQVENEIQIKLKHLTGEQKNSVLTFIRGLTGTNAQKYPKRKALRQIRAAINEQH